MSANPTIFFAPLKVPLSDPRTGLMSREWYLFFQALFLRVGGSGGQSNDQLQQQITVLQSEQDAISQEPFSVIAPTFDDLLGELRATRDQVAELTKRLDDIQQGTQL